MNIQHISLKDYTSLHIGGESDMVTVASEVALGEVCDYAKVNNLRIHILGEGTNTVFSNTLPDLLIVKMEMKGQSIVISNQSTEKTEADEVLLTVGAGETWDDVVKFSVDANLWGIENLSGVPGTVGASPVQNIGAYGVDLKDIFVSLRAYDITTMEFISFSNDACQFGYRDSLFKREKGRYIITEVTMKLSKTKNPKLTYKPLDTLTSKQDLMPNDVRELVLRTRAEKLPDYKTYPNAGSFFKNPIVTRSQAYAMRAKWCDMPIHDVEGGYKVPSAWLIEHVTQMKGVTMGNVGTWPAQPLVIVNYGDATYEELDAFATLITEKVSEATDIHLEREVNFIG